MIEKIRKIKLSRIPHLLFLHTIIDNMVKYEFPSYTLYKYKSESVFLEYSDKLIFDSNNVWNKVLDIYNKNEISAFVLYNDIIKTINEYIGDKYYSDITKGSIKNIIKNKSLNEK